MRNRNARILIVCLTTVISALLVSLAPRIPQPLDYHRFADERSLWGIPHGLDVLSNLGFLFAGLLGLFGLFRSRKPGVRLLSSAEKWAYGVFFLGVTLTSLGSAYYHLVPNNSTLVWDRLPMTLAFLSFLSATIAERISVRSGFVFLPPLLASRIASVFYWQHSELQGRGDLRPYLFAQFFPLLIIPVMIFLFPPRYTRTADLVGVFGAYALAKILEHFDKPIFALGQIISGHTLKHLSAAFASYLIVRMLWLRSPIQVSAHQSPER